jgi:hypothetical protein
MKAKIFSAPRMLGLKLEEKDKNQLTRAAAQAGKPESQLAREILISWLDAQPPSDPRNEILTPAEKPAINSTPRAPETTLEATDTSSAPGKTLDCQEKPAENKKAGSTL